MPGRRRRDVLASPRQVFRSVSGRETNLPPSARHRAGSGDTGWNPPIPEPNGQAWPAAVTSAGGARSGGGLSRKAQDPQEDERQAFSPTISTGARRAGFQPGVWCPVKTRAPWRSVPGSFRQLLESVYSAHPRSWTHALAVPEAVRRDTPVPSESRTSFGLVGSIGNACSLHKTLGHATSLSRQECRLSCRLKRLCRHRDNVTVADVEWLRCWPPR